MSLTTSSAPSAASRRATREPTCPRPITAIFRPETSADPNACSSVTPIAARTPSAVGPEGSPAPPSDSGRQYAYGVRSRATSMSSAVVPTSSPTP